MTNSSIEQKTGVGHNITAGDNSDITVGNIVITSLSSRDLVASTKQFLLFITYRDWKTAQAYLTSLKSVGSLDNECNNLLQLLEYKLSIAQEKDVKIHPDQFITLLRSSESDAVIKDIIESIYIHYLSLSSEVDAKKRYENSAHKGSFSEEIFYERLASKEDFIQLVAQKPSDLFEHELCSLVRCAIRCELLQMAVELADELNNRYPVDNSKILLSLAKSYLIYKVIDCKHLWLIDRECMKDLEEQISICLEFVSNSADFRSVHIATILLAATQFQAPILIDICLKNIKEAKKIIPNIDCLLSTDSENTDDSISARHVLRQKNLTINEVEFSKIFTAVMKGEIASSDVQRWLDKGGDVAVPDQNENEFMRIALSAIACDPENKQQKIILTEGLDNFLETNANKLKEFNILAMYQLCLSLKNAGLSLYVVKLIESFLPVSPWCSPAIDVYAEALLDSDQISKLDELLEKMEGVRESFRFMAIKIERAILSGNFVQSIQLAEQALTRFPDSCYYWAVLLRVLHLDNTSPSQIAIYISKMPKEIFEKYSYEGLRLLHLIAKTDLPFAESIILEWFIDEPVGMAGLPSFY